MRVAQVLEDVDHLERLATTTEEQEEVEADMIALCVRGCRFGIRLGGLCARYTRERGHKDVSVSVSVCMYMNRMQPCEVVESHSHKRRTPWARGRVCTVTAV